MIRYSAMDVYSFNIFRLELQTNQHPNGKVFTITEKGSFAALIQLKEQSAGYLREDWGATVRAARLVAGWP